MNTLFMEVMMVKNGGKSLAEGTFSNIENNPNRRIVKFDKDVEIQFVKVVSKSGVRESGTASLAEIEVFR